MKNLKLLVFGIFLVGAGYGVYEFVDRVLLARKILTIPNPNAEYKLATASEFQLLDTEGRQISPSLFKGKVVIVHFWASWCPPCVEEFPSLAQFAQSFDGKVVVLALSNDYADREMRKFIGRFQLNSDVIRVAWDAEHRVADVYGTNKLPETYIFDRELKFVAKISKAQNWSEPSLVQKIRELVQQSP